MNWDENFGGKAAVGKWKMGDYFIVFQCASMNNHSGPCRGSGCVVAGCRTEFAG
jgi:hypothetical protein